ncbi:MAG TPA: LamG domain-containing protein [Polyangiaceae bacterium]
MIRKLLLASVVTVSAITACDDDGDDDGGLGGKAGSAGRGGTAGKGGSSGGGSGGISGSGGTSGSAGISGSGGMSGTGGTLGGAGGQAGVGGTAGADGGAGKGGTAGAGGGGAGKGGTAGTGGASDSGSDASEGGIIDEALRIHLTFDETSGTVANDSSPNNLDATLHGATWATGRNGGAVDLSNNDTPKQGPAGKQWVSLPPNVLSPCDDATVAVWVRLRSLHAFTRILDLDGGVNGFIFMTATAGPPGAQGVFFNIYKPNDAGPADQAVRGAYPAADAGTVLLGEWHHIAITLSGQVARAYFDGVQVGQNPNMTFNPSQIVIRPDGGGGGEPHAWLGRSLFWDADPYLNAQLDDLRISCRAYTPAEIAELAD